MWYRCVTEFPCWDKSEADAVSGIRGSKLHLGSEEHPSYSSFLELHTSPCSKKRGKHSDKWSIQGIQRPTFK